MNPSTLAAVNDQIQAEMESAYTYLAMSLLANDHSLSGIAHWLKMQWQEEVGHAMKLVEHVHARGGSVQLRSLALEQPVWTNVLGLFKEVEKHEKHITARINALYENAISQKDYPLQILLQWFINEQVEEEESVRSIIERIELSGETGASLLFLDRQLGERA